MIEKCDSSSLQDRRVFGSFGFYFSENQEKRKAEPPIALQMVLYVPPAICLELQIMRHANGKGGFDLQQTCLNGHVITGYAATQPYRRQDFCALCGAKTIIQCPSCDASLRGFPLSWAVADRSSPAAFCYNCGKAYPWTESRLEAAAVLIQENDVLNLEDKTQLTSSLPEIVAETPKTPLAIARLKKILPKAGTVFSDALQKIIVDIAVESAKKAIWG